MENTRSATRTLEDRRRPGRLSAEELGIGHPHDFMHRYMQIHADLLHALHEAPSTDRPPVRIRLAQARDQFEHWRQRAGAVVAADPPRAGGSG